MPITIQPRDNDHTPHEALMSGVELWDVYQGTALIGVYSSEGDALAYKDLLESGALDRLQAHAA